jgi:acyl homoserine lactone synthase
MQHTILTHSLRDMNAVDRDAMFRLRAKVFSDRLGWAVTVTDEGHEVDDFDRLSGAHYILARSPDGSVDACWRLLPTLGPNMLRDVFPELLHGLQPPAAADVWELSRFAVDASRLAEDDHAGNHQIGFGDLSVALMAESTRFAQTNGIARFVTVTTAAIERMLKKQGVDVHRVGPPLRIGHVLTVACFIEINDTTLRALGR